MGSSLPTALVQTLNKLTAEQLAEVVKLAKGLKNVAPTEHERKRFMASYAKAGTDPHDYVLATICGVCRELGRDLREVAIAKRNKAYSAFKDAVPAVVAHVREFAPNRTVETAILRRVYRHMAIEYDYGLALLMSNTVRVPAMLDEMYPGYYQLGLMSLVVNKLKR